MPRILSCVIAQDIIQGVDNRVSIINIITGFRITIRPDESVDVNGLWPLNAIVATLFYRDADEPVGPYEGSISVAYPDGRQVNGSVIPFDMPEPRQIMKSPMSAFPIGVAGIYHLKFLVKSPDSNNFIEMADCPIEVGYDYDENASKLEMEDSTLIGVPL